MKCHSKSFEQYCCIMQKNVVIEEINYHNGQRVFRCTMHPQCVECKNSILRYRFEEKTDNTAIDI